MVVREQTFSDFLQFATGKCELIDISQSPDWQPGNRMKLAVTFDDGWWDNATVADPIARKHQVPMAIFIVPKKIGAALPFWPERAASVLEQGPALTGRKEDANYIERTIENLKGLPAEERNQRVGHLAAEYSAPESFPDVDRTMTWEQVSQLDHHGVIFGSHTSTHEILTSIPLAQAEEEIAGSRRHIERELGKSCWLFSYPNGDCSDEVRKLVQRAGYRFAFLNQDPGVWMRHGDPYLIPRVNVCEYHLVDARGKFSPLIFDYAVVWNAAKGLMKQTLAHWFSRVRGKSKSWPGTLADQKNHRTTKNTKEHKGFSS
jgi:peptidoglycan/xylan/chitin deacetylase (PgdA/CDA1 family)